MTGPEAWQTLEEIRRQHGGSLRPEFIVAAAAAEDHPLHDEFTWDDSAAAALYRLDQARQLIRRVRLVDADHPEAPRDLRAYVNVRAGGQPGQYVPTAQAAMDPIAREVILRSMEREWRGLFRRYRQFAEFAAMVATDLGIELETSENGT